MNQNTCLNCGKELTHVAGRRSKKFCNDSCRVSFSRKKSKGKIVVLIEDENGRFTLDGKKCSLVFENEETTDRKKEELSKMVQGIEPSGLREKNKSTKISELENELSNITGTSSIAKSRKKFIETEIKKLKK
jgi:hypothetical protein